VEKDSAVRFTALSARSRVHDRSAGAGFFGADAGFFGAGAGFFGAGVGSDLPIGAATGFVVTGGGGAGFVAACATGALIPMSATSADAIASVSLMLLM
jgi:hypothetical protein